MGHENNMEIQSTFADAKMNWRDCTTRPHSHVTAFNILYRNRQHIFPAFWFYNHYYYLPQLIHVACIQDLLEESYVQFSVAHVFHFLCDKTFMTHNIFIKYA